MTHPLATTIDSIVVDAIVNQPRSRQKLIGPSEIGTDCVRCLARKLAGIAKNPVTEVADAPWLPYIGTCVHAGLEEVFEKDNAKRVAEKKPARWEVEKRLYIGQIGDIEIHGSCDLYDYETNTVVDHKLVGKTKLDSVRRKNDPGATYRVQAHLYGYGWYQLGFDVQEVAVKFYPRNEISLSRGEFWSEPYNQEIAETAMARANEIYEAVVAHTESGTLNTYLKSLATASDCFSCPEYPSLEPPVEVFVDDLFIQPIK